MYIFSHPGCKKIRTTKDSGALGEKAANKSGVRTCNAFWNPQVNLTKLLNYPPSHTSILLISPPVKKKLFKYLKSKAKK